MRYRNAFLKGSGIVTLVILSLVGIFGPLTLIGWTKELWPALLYIPIGGLVATVDAWASDHIRDWK